MGVGVRDSLLFVGCVILPCTAGWVLEDPIEWQWFQYVGAVLFISATVMVFFGLRLLLTPSVAPPIARHTFAPEESSSTSSSEIIHVEYKEESARVVALLKLGENADDVHLLELDVCGTDLRPEVLEDAVRGVASGEPQELDDSVDKVGYACGWGLTLPCPPFQH